MRFGWDSRKNAENIHKHGIAFADAAGMFQHPMLVGLDTREDYGEDRWIGIGLLRDVVAVVVFTEKPDGTVRIISARKATKHETQRYGEYLSH